MKRILLLILAFAPMLANAQFVRQTQACGTVEAFDGVTCDFSVTKDTDIIDGMRTGFITITITSPRPAANGGKVQYNELPALLQTLRYAKDNPPASGNGGSTRIIFRTDDIMEITCDAKYGSLTEDYVEIRPLKQNSSLLARVPWSRIDELIAALEECKDILDAHCTQK